MLTSQTRRFLLIVVYLLFFPVQGHADTIFLKNGSAIEGIIAREDDRGITIQLGAGTISIKHDEIDRIERSDVDGQSRIKKDWGTRYFLNDTHVPPDLKVIAEKYKQLENTRNAALEYKHRKDELIEELDVLKEEITNTRGQLSALGKRLAQAKGLNDIPAYNTIIKNYNTAMGRLTTTQIDYDALAQRLPELNKQLNAYMDRVRTLRKETERISDQRTDVRADEETTFLETILEHITALEDELEQHFITYEGDASRMIVQTLLNNRVTANLIIDTGASMVLISPRIAESLDIDYRNAPTAQTTLADGRKVPAYMILLESVKIGDAVLSNVPASVIDENTAAEDGLLGMSFLQNFMVRLDPQNNQLILEEFNP